ncbi:MAG: enoyl-CoA hydratase/isomerase family protein, partial [Planctomycetota bacterium]|nr:enoyl-CoA hydratase/isomerase family protein [Planctomycetota bacterium]
AKTIGLIDHICDVAEMDEFVRKLALGEMEGKRETVKLSERWGRIRELFSDKNFRNLLEFKADGGDEAAQKIVKVLKRKAPIALKLAAEILDAGYGKPIEEASRLELSHLEEVFKTEDALEGLTSVMERRFPVFKGR